MRMLIPVFAALALATPAGAQERASTTAMTCGQARAFLEARGEAVIGTGGMTFDRFVTDRTHCAPTQTTKQAFVPTTDTRACPIGYTCAEPFWDRNDGRD